MKNKPCRVKNSLHYTRNVRFFLLIWKIAGQCIMTTVFVFCSEAVFSNCFSSYEKPLISSLETIWEVALYLELFVKDLLMLNFVNLSCCHWSCLLNGLCKSLHILLPHVHALCITAVTVFFKVFWSLCLKGSTQWINCKKDIAGTFIF